MNEMINPPGIGHNNPPGPYIPPDLLQKVQDHTDAAGAWLDLKVIETEEQAQKATDFIAGARGVWKVLEAERKKQKEPHDLAAKAVQDLFTPFLDKVKKAAEKVQELQTAFLTAKAKREEAERLAREAEARRAREEAERLAREAEARNDVSGMVDAERAKAEAEKAAKAAAAPVKTSVASATGAGRTIALRTTWFAVVDNINVAFVTYRDHPEVRALLERIATADVRSQQGDKTAPNGFKLRKEEKAA